MLANCSIAPNAVRNTGRSVAKLDGVPTATYCYDKADRLVSSTDASVGSPTYDNRGNTKTIGAQTLYWDGADRHMETDVSGGPTVSYRRDATGRIVERTEGSSVVRYGYTGPGDSAAFTLTNGTPMLAIRAESDMRVFSITFDLNRFQALLVDGDDEFSFPFFTTMQFAHGPLGKAWNPPPVYVDRPRLARPDIFHLVGAIGLVLGPRARSELDRIASLSGELLPLPFGAELLCLLNVTEVIDCLDAVRTVFDGGGVAKRLEFLPHRISEAPIFRIPQNRSSELFCHEGIGEPTWDFKATVEQANLTGVVFTEVWNSEVGGLERPPRW